MRELPVVLVRGADGKSMRCRAVYYRDGYVYVVSEREYQEARRIGVEIEPRLGFPTEDVTFEGERPAV
jgi:hypothetical protein